MVTVPARRTSLAVSLSGIAALVIGAALVLLLHVVGPTGRISATRRTISEYGLGESAWVFDLAVLLVAAGSVAGFGALWWQRRLPVLAAAFGALWTVGLLVIVAFPQAGLDHWTRTTRPWAGPCTGTASVVAFVCPAAGRARRGAGGLSRTPGCGGWLARVLAARVARPGSSVILRPR